MAKHGFEQVGIDEIRQELKDKWGVTDPDVLKQTKKPLVTLLLEKRKEDNSQEQEMFVTNKSGHNPATSGHNQDIENNKNKQETEILKTTGHNPDIIDVEDKLGFPPEERGEIELGSKRPYSEYTEFPGGSAVPMTWLKRPPNSESDQKLHKECGGMVLDGRCLTDEEAENVRASEDSLNKIEENNDGLFGEESQEEEKVAELIPRFNSPEYQEYVMRQFENDELDGEYPTCDGLRRVVEKLLGPINGPTIPWNDPPNKNNQGTATVVVKVLVNIQNDETHPLYGETIVVEEIANCGSYNTQQPFCQHQSATACTRAEGRAYRKILRLRKIISAEEANSREGVDAEVEFSETWAPSKPIEDSQIAVIDMLCKRLGVDVMAFINAGQFSYANIGQVTYMSAQKIIQHLNKIQRGLSQIPEKVAEVKYNPGWRN